MSKALESFLSWAILVAGAIAAFLMLPAHPGMNQPFAWVGLALCVPASWQLLALVSPPFPKPWPKLVTYGTVLGMGSIVFAICDHRFGDMFDSSQSHFVLWTIVRLTLLLTVIIEGTVIVLETEEKNQERARI